MAKQKPFTVHVGTAGPLKTKFRSFKKALVAAEKMTVNLKTGYMVSIYQGKTKVKDLRPTIRCSSCDGLMRLHVSAIVDWFYCHECDLSAHRERK